jgi:hypothetical protein
MLRGVWSRVILGPSWCNLGVGAVAMAVLAVVGVVVGWTSSKHSMGTQSLQPSRRLSRLRSHGSSFILNMTHLCLLIGYEAPDMNRHERHPLAFKRLSYLGPSLICNFPEISSRYSMSP